MWMHANAYSMIINKYVQIYAFFCAFRLIVLFLKSMYESMHMHTYIGTAKFSILPSCYWLKLSIPLIFLFALLEVQRNQVIPSRRRLQPIPVVVPLPRFSIAGRAEGPVRSCRQAKCRSQIGNSAVWEKAPPLRPRLRHRVTSRRLNTRLTAGVETKLGRFVDERSVAQFPFLCRIVRNASFYQNCPLASPTVQAARVWADGL